MKSGVEDSYYQAESADRIVGQLFGGKLSTDQALQKLRTRLLDLSSRNRLLNYRHPKGRSIQFVNEPNLNLVFDRLVDGKSLLIKYVPDPPPSSYMDKRPDGKTYAETLGISIETEFPLSSCDSSANKHKPKLQALSYPVDLDRFCRKLSSEARSIIEETGTNMLYLIFGFLEFYENEDSNKPMLAPLLAVPVALEKGVIDEGTRTYKYSVVHSGEDVHENQTLHEKLSQDYALQLPGLEEEEVPGSYFIKIQHAVRNKKRWRVRYQLTLGFLSFGKLAIWNDLDPTKCPALLHHPLLNELFSGGSGHDSSLYPEDYDIDKHPQGELPVIYDADSSQHSAIIDVLSGKNMVINGPPGTGKSQTITNIIAAALHAGQRVLFVSEKLAALEVVRHRLNQANLGHFCLELHSHKTQKRKLLSDIQERLDARFRPPQQYQDKLSTLKRHKKSLNRYAEFISSQIGNKLGLSVYEILWRAESRRQAIGDLANAVQSLFLADAPKWSYDDIELRRAKLETLGQLYAAIGSFNHKHPWWGFSPRPLSPGDDEAIGRTIKDTAALSEKLEEAVFSYQTRTGEQVEPILSEIAKLHTALQALSEPPTNLNCDLIPRVFNGIDQLGTRNRNLLTSAIQKVEQARALYLEADSVLLPRCEIESEKAAQMMSACSDILAPATMSLSESTLDEPIAASRLALNVFHLTISRASYRFMPIETNTLQSLNESIAGVSPLSLLSTPIHNLRDGVSILTLEINRLSQSFGRVVGIATSRGIDFDGSPSAVARLARPDGIEGVLSGVPLDDAVVSKAQQAANYVLAELPISELHRRQQQLQELHEYVNRLLEEMRAYAVQCEMQFDCTQGAISRLNTLARISSRAPLGLLDYRCQTLANPSTLELVNAAQNAQVQELSQREKLGQEFYLDALPSVDELRAIIRVFRRGDSLFNIFSSQWRGARRQFRNLVKTKKRRGAADCEILLSEIVNWMEQRAEFISNKEYARVFGTLFKGLDTDFSKIRRLNSWYTESLAEILRYPGLVESVDLTSLAVLKINQLAASSSRIQVIQSELEESATKAKEALGPVYGRVEQILMRSGWAEFSRCLLQVAKGLRGVSSFLGRYVRQEISPKRAVDILSATLEVLGAQDDFKALSHGVEEVHRRTGHLLPGISSIACHFWADYISLLTRLAHATGTLEQFASQYGYDETSIGDVRALFETKVKVDLTLKKIAPLPQMEVLQDWHFYYERAASAVQAGSQLLELLRATGIKGKTGNDVVRGLITRIEGDHIMAGVANDATVTGILQDQFAGVETNLDTIRTTLEWIEAVVCNKTLCQSSLKNLLLSSQATENFFWLRPNMGKVVSLASAVKGKLNELSEYGSLDWDTWNQSGEEWPMDRFASSIVRRIDSASRDVDAVLLWSKYHTERSECNSYSLQDFVTALEQEQVPLNAVGTTFEYVVYRSIGRGIYQTIPGLESFSGAKHEKKRAEFARLDREIIGLTGKGFAYDIDRNKTVPNGEIGYRINERTEMQLLRHELSKQRRHLPIRQLLKRAGGTIQALKPCFMMGPMSVALYLEQGAVEFDIVIMDEASQLRPEEALGAIARGKQLVVVGDPKQLPPTSFFEHMLDGGSEGDEEETPSVLEGSESILDICQQLYHPVRTLRWHYRSQHESLIAFSNHYFYNAKLVVFPSPFDRNPKLGVRYRYIMNGSYGDRQNVPEALRVVDATVEQMMKYPGESLGVVTLNQTQRDLIEDLFDKKLRSVDEVQAFVSSWEEKGWPFFIKNLENVQGDERDIIFISTTFGKPAGAEKVRQNFGPISRPDGWRRLNVLFTRARRKIELFTSMLPEDIVLETKTPGGTRALKDYLDYARRGVLTNTSISEREPDSDFEIVVGNLLRNHGYEVVPQLGVAGFYIDMVVRNPVRPGEFLAAVECDGATYHSSKSARDRDCIRQSILESLGWKDRIWRIWSTDWFFDPRRESQRLIAFMEGRVAISRSEIPSDYAIDEVQKESAETSEVDTAEVTRAAISEEELFVEVGDRVIYCFAEQSDERMSVMIVDTESNPKLRLINENTPLAQVLLNSAVGDELEMKIDGRPTRYIRVLKIQRQEELNI